MSVRVFSVVALLAITSFTMGSPLAAQGTRYQEPAEFPPASFTGSQYVDSRGCIFVRAGIGGSTSWVPRVSASRQNLCGAQPSLPSGASAQTQITGQDAVPPGATLITAPPAAVASAAPVAAPRPAPATAPAPAAAATSTARAEPVARPAPAARVNARVAPPPPSVAQRPGAPMRTIASITTPPTIGRVAEPRPQTRIVDARTAPARPVVLSVARCGAGMRCGPQTQDPVGAVRQAASVAPLLKPAPGTVVRTRDLAKLDPQTRIVPRHVAQAQANAATVAGMPQGYRPVWNDDRLNPRRAQGTVAGKAAMDLVWTNTVPRRLIDRNSGRDMTAYNPNLQYPYTELTEQVRAGNRTQQAPTISTRATPKPPASARAAAQPAAAPKAARVAGRFVQVGAFGDPANANRVVGRLQAAGLPVSIQRSSSKGKPVQVILAGPFGDPASTAHALDRARAAGFRDAFARN